MLCVKNRHYYSGPPPPEQFVVSTVPTYPFEVIEITGY